MRSLPRLLWTNAFVLIGAMVACFAGCSDSSTPTRFAIHGKVTLDSRPLDDVVIRFVPKNAGTRAEPAFGASGIVSQGSFQIEQSDGPTAGDFDVVLVPNAPELEQAIESMQSGSRDPLGVAKIPSQFQTPGRLQHTIGPGTRDFRLDLSSR